MFGHLDYGVLTMRRAHFIFTAVLVLLRLEPVHRCHAQAVFPHAFWQRTDIGSPLLAYGFSEGSGTTTADKTGNGHTLTYTGGGAGWTATGHTGQGYTTVTASTAAANTANFASVNQFTLMAWVNPSLTATPGNEYEVLAKNNAAAYTYTAIALEYSNYADSGFTGQPAGWVLISGTYYEVQGSSVLPLNTWVHLALVYDGNNLILYVNGHRDSSIAATGTLDANDGIFGVGYDANPPDTMPAGGRIDDVRFYNTVLSESQIKMAMATPVP